MVEASCTEYQGDVWPAPTSLRTGPVETRAHVVAEKCRPLVLRDQKKAGTVLGRVHPEVPPRVEYALDELGRTLEPAIRAMRAQGIAHQHLAAERSA